MHVCALSGLVPSAAYAYRVGSMADGFSDVYTFTASPPQGKEGVNIIMYGDMGVTHSIPTVNLIADMADQIDFVVHAGDICTLIIVYHQ